MGSTEMIRSRLSTVSVRGLLVASFVVGLAAAPVVTSALGERDRSDRFWNASAVRGMAAEEFDSLGSMAQSSDLVVVANIESVERGREWIINKAFASDPDRSELGWARFATARLSVVQILGTPRVPIPAEGLLLEIYLPRPDTLDALISNRPGEQAIFFLRNKGAEDDPRFFRFVNDEQGLLREFDGSVAVTPFAESDFLRHLDGASFGEVIRHIASSVE